MDILFYFYFINSFFTLFVIFLLFFFLTSLLFSLYMKNNFFKSLITYFKWGIILILLLLYVFYEYFSVAHFCFFQECHFWLHQSPMVLVNFSSLLFFLLAFVVSWSIMNFSISYMNDESNTISFLSFLIFFLLFMFLLVFSGNFLFLFVGWEGVSLMSFLLISWWYSRSEAISGSMQAIIYNRIGDSSLLLFLVLYLTLGNNLNLGETMILSVLFIFFLLSVLAKSSQFLFHPWLPNAMESPTPVSSLLHSSTMVVASVYLLMRCSEMFGFNFIIFIFSLFTCLLGVFFSFIQYDFKKIVAYSTTSQLGFMMMMLGLGFVNYCGLYMMAHAFFKALIFMMSSYIIHMSSSNQDFRGLNSVSIMNKMMSYLYVIGALVMMGLPFLSSFWIKDMVLEETNYGFISSVFWFFYMMSVLMTCLYSLRLYMCFINFEYKQCFFFLIFPKMIPILMMFDLLQQEIVLISYMFLVFLVFMVSSSQSVLSIDFREILGWSSMGQMSWMILSLFSNIFLAIVYYFLYAVLLLFLIKYINQFSVKFFLSFSSYSMSSVKEIIIFFMLMFMSSVAPFLLFYMKMLIISSFFFNMFSFSMLLILFLSISILFFYLRMMQFLIGVGFYSSFYSMETKQNFMYFLYILFLFTFGGIFLLLI